MFGITIAFALACMALCWMILNDSSNLMNNKADVTLGDYIGMTKDQAMATDQIASGQISRSGKKSTTATTPPVISISSRRYPAAPSARTKRDFDR